jgi:hypothetical protein
MNKTKIGIFLSLMLVLGFCSSCGEKESNSKLLLNEVLITNESNFQDDYGVHSADNAETRVARFDNIIDIAILGCIVRIGKQFGIFSFFFSRFIVGNHVFEDLQNHGSSNEDGCSLHRYQ